MHLFPDYERTPAELIAEERADAVLDTDIPADADEALAVRLTVPRFQRLVDQAIEGCKREGTSFLLSHEEREALLDTDRNSVVEIEADRFCELAAKAAIAVH
jgi:hypothetical protein